MRDAVREVLDNTTLKYLADYVETDDKLNGYMFLYLILKNMFIYKCVVNNNYNSTVHSLFCISELT